MPYDAAPTLPTAKADPPWCFCGDRASPDFGTVFAHPAARGGALLTYDRAGRHHALTVYDARTLGDEVVIHGRRFAVRTAEAG